jgi:hypothetical protein
MVPPDSPSQELTVPNLQIARGLSCVVFFGFISSAARKDVGIVAHVDAVLSADLQATAP